MGKKIFLYYEGATVDKKRTGLLSETVTIADKNSIKRKISG
jgi:hypothetical protein